MEDPPTQVDTWRPGSVAVAPDGRPGPVPAPEPEHRASSRRGWSQTSALTAGRLVAAATSFVWMAVLARSVPVDAMGSLTLGLSLAMALNVLADLGLPMILSDRAASHPHESVALLRRAGAIRTAASVVTGVLLVVMFGLASDGSTWIPLLLGVSVLGTAMYTSATAVLRGLGRVAPDAVNEVVSRLVVLGAGIAVLAAGGGVVAAAAVLALTDLGSAVVLTWIADRRSPRPVVAAPAGVTSWKVLVPLTAALLVASLHLRIDVWILAMLTTTADVAHYTVPARVAEGLLIPAAAAAALVLPLTAAGRTERARGRIARRYVGIVSGVVAAMSLLVAVVAPNLLDVAFGSRYAGDADVLRVLCLATVPASVAVGLAPLVAILRRLRFLALVVAAVVINVGACLVLVPTHRAVGAAWASVLSMTLLAIGLLAVVSSLPDGTDGVA